MKAKILKWDEWQGADQHLRESVIEELESRIRDLDGENKTELVIIIEEDVEELTIAGGAGDYIVSALSNGETATALSGNAVADMVEMTVGGQTAEYERRYVLSLEQTIEAANCFAATGGLTPKLQWE